MIINQTENQISKSIKSGYKVSGIFVGILIVLITLWYFSIVSSVAVFLSVSFMTGLMAHSIIKTKMIYSKLQKIKRNGIHLITTDRLKTAKLLASSMDITLYGFKEDNDTYIVLFDTKINFTKFTLKWDQL